MDVAILLYDGLTALDAVGPYQVLCQVPGASTPFVAERAGAVVDDAGRLVLHVAAALSELPRPDVLVVPGGPEQTRLMAHRPARPSRRPLGSSP